MMRETYCHPAKHTCLPWTIASSLHMSPLPHLQILVVGGGCALDNRKQACHVALHGTALATDQLERVWVLRVQYVKCEGVWVARLRV